MRSLALFRPTFQKIQRVISEVQTIKQTTFQTARKRAEWGIQYAKQKKYRERLKLQTVWNTVQLTCNLQKQSSNCKKDINLSYDYLGKSFALSHEQPINEKIQRCNIHVRSCAVEKIDHPVLRQSLYFHELKDLDKIYNIQYPKNSPRFVRDMYRKNLQNRLLDAKNPLGVPLHAPPLQIIIEINGLFDVELYCQFGNINIRTVRLIREIVRSDGKEEKKYKQILDGMNIPREVQKVVYGVCEHMLQLDEPSIHQLHRLAYIGGRVEEIQFLANVYDYFSSGLIKMDAIC